MSELQDRIDEDLKKEAETEKSAFFKTTSLISYLVFAFLTILILSMVTCTMHSNTYDGERLRENAVVEQGKVDLKKVELQIKQTQADIERERLQTVEKMVANGLNPIAAHCAVYGFNDSDISCVVAAGAKGITPNDE